VAAWATIDQVEDWLGITQDQRMVDALDASLAWCNRTRPDLDAAVAPSADVTHAVVLFAGILYRERTSPQGFSTYDALDTSTFTDQSAMLSIYRLLGTRRPVAR